MSAPVSINLALCGGEGEPPRRRGRVRAPTLALASACSALLLLAGAAPAAAEPGEPATHGVAMPTRGSRALGPVGARGIPAGSLRAPAL